MELHTEGNPEHPLKQINSIISITNKYDNQQCCYELKLSCEHICYVTGSKIYNLTGVHCQECAKSE